MVCTIEAENAKSGLDPRPDLADDHAIWETILAEARRRNYRLRDGHMLEELFHFLRCVGVTVAVQQGKQRPYLKLIWETICKPEQDDAGHWVTWMRPEAFRETYLDPYRDAIAEHLKHTWEVRRHAQPTQSTQAAAA